MSMASYGITRQLGTRANVPDESLVHAAGLFTENEKHGYITTQLTDTTTVATGFFPAG